MCDTLCHIDADGAWFAKNSDRPPDEVQLVASVTARVPGPSLRTQYLDVGTDPGANALLVGSQPTWLWGYEHGVNERRVAIGNETVYTTDDRHAVPAALLGMDLVRLALERSTDAADALVIMTEMIERYGQGGSGWRDTSEPYFSSFLITDPTQAFVVETSHRTWVARRIDAGGVAISNRLSLSRDWTLSSPDVEAGSDWQRWRDPSAPTGIADHRLAVTSECVSNDASCAPLDVARIAEALRHHGPRHPALPAEVETDWSGVSVCMHVRGYQATTASLITRLPAEPELPARHWIALGSPCVSVYVPAIGSHVPRELSDPTTWHRVAALRARVEADPSGEMALAEIRAVLDPVEADLWSRSQHIESDADARRWSLEAFSTVSNAFAVLGV